MSEKKKSLKKPFLLYALQNAKLLFCLLSLNISRRDRLCLCQRVGGKEGGHVDEKRWRDLSLHPLGYFFVDNLSFFFAFFFTIPYRGR